MSDTIDIVGAIHAQLFRYQTMAARHAANLAQYQGPDGDTDPKQCAKYDEARFDNTIEADEFLDRLVEQLAELVGPPVPGETFTLTFAGPERQDGEKPYAFVVNGTDLDDARRKLTTLPFWQQWYEEQRGWNDPDDQAPDVLFVPDESHPGIPERGAYNDLRREQAAALAVAAAPAESPAMADAAPLSPTA